MFPVPDINSKKISFQSWKKGGHFHSIYKQKSQQPAILIFLFGSCRAQANLNFQLFPLCWHRQCKAESKQGLTALLAPSGWGCRGSLSCPTFPVPPAAIARLFILHALGKGGSSDSSSDSISPLQNCCTEALGSSQAASPWLGWAGSALGLEKVCSMLPVTFISVTPSGESNYLADTALPCGLSWQSSGCSDYLSSAVFSSQENYHVLEYLKCFETLVLESLSS